MSLTYVQRFSSGTSVAKETHGESANIGSYKMADKMQVVYVNIKRWNFMLFHVFVCGN